MVEVRPPNPELNPPELKPPELKPLPLLELKKLDGAPLEKPEGLFEGVLRVALPEEDEV